MDARPVIRKHAILKRHYRRAVAATPTFHTLGADVQWALLRDEVQADSTPAGAGLLEIMKKREARRDEVLAALEEGRQAHLR